MKKSRIHDVAGSMSANPYIPGRPRLARKNDEHETTKARILRVSAELFAKKGFHATGLSELSEAIGLGRGGLYHHIHSKDELHAEIAYVPIRAAIAEARPIVESKEPPETKIEQLSLALAAAIRNSMDEWIVFFREFSSLPQEHQVQILELRLEYLNFWRAAIAEGVESKDFIDEPPVFLDGLLPLFIYSHIWETDSDSASPMAAGESLARFILRGLRA